LRLRQGLWSDAESIPHHFVRQRTCSGGADMEVDAHADRGGSRRHI
jgi:hypothetical protein